MKPLTMLVIGALIVALLVVGYLYYQRTQNDITIQMPKIGLNN
jgi:predicted negative regulator of RcsB-dependent stress response